MPGREAGTRDRVADPQAGQAVRLGERPQQRRRSGARRTRPARRRACGSRTNSTYASSSTTSTSLRHRRRGTWPARRRARPGRSGCSGCRPARPWSAAVIAAAIASRSSRPSSPTGTRTPSAPASVIAIGYASNERHGTTTSSPGSHTAVEHVPEHRDRAAPGHDVLGRDAERRPRSRRPARSRTCPGTGSTSAAASEMASSTDGSGGYGFSFDDSLNAAAPTGTRAPGTYGGRSARAWRSGTRAHAAQHAIARRGTRRPAPDDAVTVTAASPGADESGSAPRTAPARPMAGSAHGLPRPRAHQRRRHLVRAR